MEILVFIIVILGALLAIASAIWVAFALGKAISPEKQKQESMESSSSDPEEESLYS